VSDHTPKYDHSGYLYSVIEREYIAQAVPKAVEQLSHYDFDAIACRGVSGLLIAPILAYLMHKTLIVVRKSTADTHANQMIEGDLGARRYVIVDDFVSMGTTVRAIVDEIQKACGSMRVPECIGVLEFANVVRPYTSSRSIGTIPILGKSYMEWKTEEEQKQAFEKSRIGDIYGTMVTESAGPKES